MDAFRELLERNAQAIVIFAACLACIFFVIRPLSMALIGFLHRRKIEEMKKEAAIRPPQPADNEMGELLGKAAAMGLTDQERLRRLARSNPDEAKDVVRNWIYR